jgi:hypothetical protein
MRWMGHDENEKCFKILVGGLKEKDPSEDRGIDGKIIFKCILRKLGGGCRLHSSASGWGTLASCF